MRYDECPGVLTLPEALQSANGDFIELFWKSTISDVIDELGILLCNRPIQTHSDVPDGLEIAAILHYGSMVVKRLSVSHDRNYLKLLKSLK